MIVTVYIDESGTHGSPVTILGGWVGRLGQWATFDSKWKKLLKGDKLTYFHSRKFRHTKGEFKDWNAERKNAFLDKAQRVSLRVGFESHEARAMRRTRSMTEAA